MKRTSSNEVKLRPNNENDAHTSPYTFTSLAPAAPAPNRSFLCYPSSASNSIPDDGGCRWGQPTALVPNAPSPASCLFSSFQSTLGQRSSPVADGKGYDNNANPAGAALPDTTSMFTRQQDISLPEFRTDRRAGGEHQPGLTEGEMLVVKDMNQLSFVERDTIYQEIHGVAPMHNEERDLVEERLERLDKEIRYQSGKAAYEKALFLNPSYVRDRQFRLMFLRADDFDPAKAAKRMVLHFQSKYELFGADRIARRIRWDDLREDTKEAIGQGDMHLFPFCKDRAGRAVLFKLYAFRKDEDSVAHYQKFWYVVMSCFQRDVEIQRKGLVVVLYSLDATISHFFREIQAQRQRIAWSFCLPLRVSGVHFCLEDDRFRPLFSILQTAVPKNLRLRTRNHFGGHMFTQYQLNSFGIPADIIPVTSDGHLKRAQFESNFRRLRDFEKAIVDEKDDGVRLHQNGECHHEALVSDGNGASITFDDIELIDDIDCAVVDPAVEKNATDTMHKLAVAPLPNSDPNTLANQNTKKKRIDASSAAAAAVLGGQYINSAASSQREGVSKNESVVEGTNTNSQKSRLTTAAAAHRDCSNGTHHPSIVMCATEKDVLLGKGIPFQRHTGNLELMRTIETFRKLHESSTRREKAVIAKKIVRLIKEKGGRFLKRNAEYANPIIKSCKGEDEQKRYWLEVDDDVAREKVAMSFRNKKRQQQQKKPE